MSKQTGFIGERVAVEYLKKKGYQILEVNWGDKWGEIDIIALDKECVVFVEVKTKVGDSFGSPEDMINQRKLEQIQKIASGYELARDSLKRIDVVAVVLNKDHGVERISHYEAVY